MPAPKLTSRITPYVQELLENQYAQENLRDAAEKLRSTYERSRRRRVKSARDKKLRAQLTVAAASLSEGARALANGRRKPERRRGKWLLLLLGVVVLGAGVAFAADEGLRSSIFGSDPAPGAEGMVS